MQIIVYIHNVLADLKWWLLRNGHLKHNSNAPKFCTVYKLVEQSRYVNEQQIGIFYHFLGDLFVVDIFLGEPKFLRNLFITFCLYRLHLRSLRCGVSSFLPLNKSIAKGMSIWVSINSVFSSFVYTNEVSRFVLLKTEGIKL